jgi:DNA-directed RNA polymerase specialized sigma24 family protein
VVEITRERCEGSVVASAQLGDAALAQRIGAKDARALEALYDRYGGLIFSLTLQLSGDRDAAAEVAQDVFVRLWTDAARYRADRGTLLSWLRTVAHHRTIDVLRRRRARPWVAGLDAEVAFVEAPGGDPSTAFARGEARRPFGAPWRSCPIANAGRSSWRTTGG